MHTILYIALIQACLANSVTEKSQTYYVGTVRNTRVNATVTQEEDIKTGIKYGLVTFTARNSDQTTCKFTFDLGSVNTADFKVRVGDFVGLRRNQVFVATSQRAYLLDCNGQ